MANKYVDERNYFQNGANYDCQQASRGYRQNRDNSLGQQRTQKCSSSNVVPQSYCNKEQESSQENEKQCQYLKYPLPPPRVPLKGKPSATGPHQCQVMVNTPRYYKPKPHRHPSALSIPLLSRPESEIHLKARSRTKMVDDSSVREKRKRAKQRTLNKHQTEESPQQLNNMKNSDVISVDGSSDEDDLKSVSLRAYSSGCLSVDISNQVGDLVKAFNTVSKRHKVKKIVYEEIEPVYTKCELQQLKPQKKNSQKRLKNHFEKPEQNFDCEPDLEVPENEEDLERKCTCNEKENLDLRNTSDHGDSEKKDVDRLEKLFLEVFAQGKVEGLSKQKRLDCLQDAYNQYSAALEDFSNNPELYPDDCLISQNSSQPNFITQENATHSESYEEIGLQSSTGKKTTAGRRYRQVQNREKSPNESINGDENTCNENEPTETKQKVMQCTCNHRNDVANTHLAEQQKNVNTNYKSLPYSQIDFSQMFANQRQNILFEMDATENNIANTINYQQNPASNMVKSDETDSSQYNFQTQKSVPMDGINSKKDSSITADSGITRTLNSRISNQTLDQNDNTKGSTPRSGIPCPAPPKLSISDDHFRSDNRHYCGHLQCFQRSKSKGVEIANMEKRQFLRNKSKDRQSSEVQNHMYGQESPIIYDDFPSEVPNSNRTRIQVDGLTLQPRKPINYDTEIRSAEIIRNNENNTYNNRTSSIENMNLTSATTNENIGFNPFLNFLVQNDSNYNISNIVPENQNVYFCDVTSNLQQHYTNQNGHEGCDDHHTHTKKHEDTSPFQNAANTNFLLNTHSSTGVAKWHDMNKHKAGENQICIANEDNQDNQMTDDYSKSTRRILEGVRENMATNSKETRRMKPSDCNFEQINNTCSDQSSYKNYIESIIDNSAELLANKTEVPALIKAQGSICQTNMKTEAETATDMDDSASQTDSKLGQEISQRLNDRLVQPENVMSPASLVTLEEPEYLQHLKKLRWDHLRHISREVHRLENLERFLDSCGCGHMMVNKEMT